MAESSTKTLKTFVSVQVGKEKFLTWTRRSFFSPPLTNIFIYFAVNQMKKMQIKNFSSFLKKSFQL